MNKKYIKYFTLLILIIFPLSCAKVLTPKRRRKPTKIIIKKLAREKIVIKKRKKSVDPEEEIVIEESKPPKKQVKKIKPRKTIKPGLPVMLPTFFNKKDSSDMAFVNSGHFIMGDNEGEENERPASEVHVAAFYIDIYEITNKQYKLFNSTFESAVLDCDLCPVTEITWKEAENYCKWAGKRLPTEPEWEKTARGSQKLKWPWGNSPKKNTANILENAESQREAKHRAGPVPVGSFPRGISVFGVFDMAGNVWEWTDSFYSPYKNNPTPDVRYQKHYRVLRGGSWKNISKNVRTTFRHPSAPDTKLPNIGFRCARDAGKSKSHSIRSRNR